MKLTAEQVKKLQRSRAGRNRLRLAIELADVTQDVLAEAIGVRQAYVSKLTLGRYSDVPLETSRAIADFFGCQIEDLFPSRSAVAS